MRRVTILVLAIWLLTVGGGFYWNLVDERKALEQLAFDTTRAFFRQVLVSRAWNAGHGGVYVPVTEDTPPNPYLDIPDRDVVTTDGLKLTKINPAFMTRQISETSAVGGKRIQFHITSLNPIRPENEATEWEKEWLKSFEEGIPEQGEFVYADGQRTFRYMAPLMVEESCMKCHAKQGYEVGKVRGGISVTVPEFPEPAQQGLILGHGLAAFVGVILIVIGGNLLAKKEGQLKTANTSLVAEQAVLKETITQLESEKGKVKELSGVVPICSYCKGIRDDKGYWNKLEEYIAKHAGAEFSHGICETCMTELYPNVKRQTPPAETTEKG